NQQVTTTKGVKIQPTLRGQFSTVVDILADAYPSILITNDIQRRLRARFGCNHRYRRENDDPQHIPASLPRDCKFGNDCPGQCWYAQAYPQLRRLAALGIIEWYPAHAGGLSASWRLADPASDLPDDPPPVAVIDLDGPRV
ncbi:hypothetical protein ACJH6J_20130, partial [Mycobacterium sp. SMC-18]|uniref:hypothetical protein n=1 Tax=Mycobacterium sp. SMC-18 TaxID=3381629 RepID=UPI0038761A3B